MEEEQKNYIYDVVIVGGGSAGVAAAYALKDSGNKVLLIEKQKQLGGTAALAYVYDWIAGAFPKYLGDIFSYLKNEGKAQGDLDNSWLLNQFNKEKDESGFDHSLRMSPEDLSQKYYMDLKNYIDIWFEHRFLGIEEMKDESVSEIKIFDKENNVEKLVSARFFIDSSADAVLCCDKGEKNKDFFFGRDKRSLYNESLAAENPSYPNHMNEPSLYFLLSENGDDKKLLDEVKSVYPNPNPTSEDDAVINNADVNSDGYVNSYPFESENYYCCNPMTGFGFTGIQVIEEGVDAIYEKSKEKLLEYWKYIKLNLSLRHDNYGYDDKRRWKSWHIAERKLNYEGLVAPMLGIRESYRVSCESMLTQNDLSTPIDLKNWENYDYIAIGSFEIDMHNKFGLDKDAIKEFNNNDLRPHGVPYKTLLPKRFSNVLIACRAFGASQIAASSFRINKAMAQLGWAAGNAVKYCIDKNKSLKNIDLCDKDKELREEKYIDFEYYVENIKSCVKEGVL